MGPGDYNLEKSIIHNGRSISAKYKKVSRPSTPSALEYHVDEAKAKILPSAANFSMKFNRQIDTTDKFQKSSPAAN